MSINDIIDILLKNSLSFEDRKKLESINFDDYFDEIISINNPYMFDKIIKYIMNKSYVDKYYKKRDEFIKKTILNQKDGRILDCLLDINKNNYRESSLFTKFNIENIERMANFNEALEVLSERWLLDDIIMYFFHDNYYNFLVNTNNMFRYLYDINKMIISKENFDFYNACQSLSKKTFADRIAFFKENYLKGNMDEKFYDDMRTIKNHSYQNIVSNSLNLNKDKALYNRGLSFKYHVPVYYLNGEKFYAMIRYIKSNKDNTSNYDDYVYSNINRDYYSFSLIGHGNIGTIGFYGDGFFLLYSDIDPNNITHVHHMDSSSGIAEGKKEFFSTRVNEIHTPSSLIQNTDLYNEIVIKKGENGIKPSALICFDEIRDVDVEFSKKYQLPIVLINRNKYHYENGYTDFMYPDTYQL